MSRLPEDRQGWATTEEAGRDAMYGVYAVNRRGLSRKVWRLQQKLYVKAKREPRFRFYALYDRIYRKDVLLNAWQRVAANDGAPGVDGVSIRELRDDPEAVGALLDELHSSLRDRTYRPSAVKRVNIPKAGGGERPLGIPTVRDRIAQMAALLVLEPIFEADFKDCSHGFRPGRKAQDAVEAISQAIEQGRTAVFDADLKSYFDTIPHDKLLVSVERRVSDGSVLKLIRQWLEAPIVEEDQPPRRPRSGTPQGGVLSPLLANVYLHWLDMKFHASTGPGRWANARLIRYADDFVICARYIDNRIKGWLEQLLQRLGLTLNQTKTQVVQVRPGGQAVSFLGFTLRVVKRRGGGRRTQVTPSPRSVHRAMERVSLMTGPRYGRVPVRLLVGRVNGFLEGWSGYFRFGESHRSLSKLDWHVQQRLVRHLKRRSQRPYRRPGDVTWYQHLHGQLGLIRAASDRRQPTRESHGKAGCGKSARPV